MVNTTIKDIDLSQITSEAEHVELITNLLQENDLTENEEGQIVSLFKKSSNDSILNEIISVLSKTQINESNAFIEIYSQWDKNNTVPNVYRFGSLVGLSINYPQLTFHNAELIIKALDQRYKNGRHSFKTQSLIVNQTHDIENLPEEVKKAVKSLLINCKGLFRDNYSLNNTRDKLNIGKCS
ncbi:MAG: hypothetical protein RIF33_02145 [Cyclobacteriaceae bacterium]